MKKELQTTPEKNNKNSLELTVYYDLKQGLNPSQIAKKYNMKSARIGYYVTKLKEQGLIKKVGYGVWKTTTKTPLHTKEKNYKSIRGHAFIFRLQIPILNNWGRRESYLIKKKIPFKRIGFFKGNQSIVIKGFRVWLCKSSIVVFFPGYKNYFANNAINAKSDAMKDFLSLIKALEGLFKTSLMIDGRYDFRLCKHHYSLIKNELAREYLKKGISFHAIQRGREWALIDNSYNLEELETVSIKADKDSVGLQKVLNSHRDNGFKVTADFILNGFDKLIEDRKYYAENLRSHVGAIQDLGKGVKKLIKKIGELK